MMESREDRAFVSPPRWGVVAGCRPSSEYRGMEKSFLGPEMLV